MDENEYKIIKDQLIQDLVKENIEERLKQLITIMEGKVDFRGAFNWLFALYEHQKKEKLTESDLHQIRHYLIELPHKRTHNEFQGSNANSSSCVKKPSMNEEDHRAVAAAMMNEKRLKNSAQQDNEHLRAKVQMLEEENKKLLKMVNQTTERLEKIGEVCESQSKTISDQYKILCQIHVSKVSKMKQIGSGKTGSVYCGTALCQGTLPVALKKPRSPKNYASFEKEMEMASRFHGSSNILQYWSKSIDEDGGPLLVMEKMDGSLKDFLQIYHRQLRLEDVKQLLIDVANGLKDLHSQNVIHRDVKTENILYKRDGHFFMMKISDLGTAAFQSTLMSPNRGSPIYAAPEGQTTDQQSPKMDVFSFGVVMWEVITGLDPHGNVEQPLNCVNYPKVKKLIEVCVRKDPAERPSMVDVINMLKQL